VPSAAESDSRPFLTIIAWPEGHDREATAQLLASEAGMDLHTLRLRLGQAPPMILGQTDPDTAARALHAMRRRGGDAFAATFADLARLGGTLKIKDLRIEHGALAIDLWRGPSTTIQRDQIQILVRAHLSQSSTKPAAGSVGSSLLSASTARGGAASRTALTFGLGGAAGLAIGFASGYIADAADPVERTIRTSDKLDIHTADGAIYQIDGDKFGYRVLGELRGHSDNANMNAMCELLAHLAPDPIVDPYFSLWRPPPGHDRLRLPDMKINRDDPAFAFYSRWAALMYRHVMG
jgi:hypothetical protein